VPIIALVVGPLLLRVQAAAGRYRKRQGGLAAQLVDVIDGLRILNGLGGKEGHLARYRRSSAELRDLGYRVGQVSSWVGALGEGLPGVFLAVVIWVTGQSALTAYRYGRVSAVLLYPLWVPMLLIPAGLFLMALCMVETLRRQLRAARGPRARRDEVPPSPEAM